MEPYSRLHLGPLHGKIKLAGCAHRRAPAETGYECLLQRLGCKSLSGHIGCNFPQMLEPSQRGTAMS